jgi:hypothetical protein
MKTAVEWLLNQIENDSDTHFHNINWDKFDELINQAKEREKQQIKDAYEKGKKYKKPIKDSNPIWLNSKPYK